MDINSGAGKVCFQRALEGWLKDLPPEESFVIKVFFSSTFTDMTTERNLLMKEAVPYLRHYCKDRGLDYQVVDMRWGVREDASLEHTTTDLCLQEIENCQHDSIGPYFVAFLGDRYGSRLFPTTIPVTEYRSIRRLASWMDEEDFAAVDKWYVVDTNAVPAVYQILPITELCPNYNDPDPKNRIVRQQHQQTWERDKVKMMNAFRTVTAEGFRRKMINSQEYEKYYISVTHGEVNKGLVNSPDVNTLNRDKVLCFHRTITDIDNSDKLAKRFTDLTDEREIDTAAAELRDELKHTVSQYLHESCISEYTVGWTDRGVTLDHPDHAAYLTTFCETFTAKMMQMIDKLTDSRDNTTSHVQELYREILRHLRFCKEKCQVFCGREKELQKIQTLLEKTTVLEEETRVTHTEVEEKVNVENRDENAQNKDMQMLLDMCKVTGATFCYGDTFDDYESDPTHDLKEEHIAMPQINKYKKPVIIHGMSGTGKTALMAKIVQLSKKWVPGSVCVVRFMGTTANSSSIRNTLVSIIMQILRLYNLQPPAGIDLHMDYHYLLQYFNSILWRIDSWTTPLFLLLDSVDQLQPMDYAHLLTWLPKRIPCNVHILVSMASDHPSCLVNAREHLSFEEQFVELGPMGKVTGDKMVRALCHQAGRTLTAAQRNLVLDTYAETGHALHMKLITNQALSWRSHHQISELQLADCVEGAIQQLFDELEKDHGEVLVAKAMGYLTLARLGLGDGEMEDILSLDDEVLQDTYIYHLPPDPHVIRLAPSLWIRLKSEIKAYLSKQQAAERPVNTWFHRHFREVALERYATSEVSAQLHGAMADYFLGTWCTQVKPLELHKGKPATYEDCLRGVPAQPLVFQGGTKKVYNTRKIQELPHHLAHSDRWDDFHSNVACNAEWLVSTCICLGVVTLLAQFKDMLSRSTDELEDAETKQKVKDIILVRSILNLAVDDIRHDPFCVPMQILGQLGPQYKGSPGIEDLVRQCKDHLFSTEQSLFVPQNAFMPAPGGLLQSSINVCLFLLGNDRRGSPSISLDESKNCMHVVEWNPGNKPDNMLIMDYDNAGVIISREKLPFSIYSYQLISKYRFHMFKIYTTLSKYQPDLEYVLFQGNLSLPYQFDKRVVAMSVASHGQLIAYAYEDDKTVHIGTPDRKARSVLVKQHMFMEHAISALLFSPDASELVAVDEKGNISCYSVNHRQTVSLHTSTERLLLSHRAPTAESMRITRSNLLLRTVLKGLDGDTLSVMDLVTRQEKHRLTSDKLVYSFSIVELDEEEAFVIVCNSDYGVVNGNRNRPALIWRLSDGELTTVIESQTPWRAAKLIAKETIFCLGSCSDVGIIQILSCGPRESPLPEAVLICELKDHSKSISSLIPLKDNTVLVSGAEDNTIKFWDLARILRERNLTEEDRRMVKRRKKKLPEEKLTEVERLGKTTAVAVTGMADQMAYFGTEKGVVGYSKLEDSSSTGIQLVTVTSDLPPVHLLVLSRKGEYLMAAAKNIVAVIDAKEGKMLYQVPGLTGEQKISCIAEGGNTAALGHGGMEGKVKLWDLKTGDFIKELSFLYSFQLTAVNRSGTQVVASMFEYPIVMNIYGTEEDAMAGGNNLRMDKLDTLMTGLTFLCISPDDSLVAACASNGSTRVVSLENQYLHRLQQRSTPSYALFTSDSQQLLTAGFRSIYVWRMGTGQLDFKLTRHQDFVTCLRFALDDRFLVSASLDRSIAIWDYKARATVSVVQTQCQLHSIHLLPDLSKITYIPDRVANLAVIAPNPALGRVLEQGRRLSDMSDPETLENASAFATSFTTQKDASKTTSVACVIL